MIRSLYAELALESLSLARSGFFPPLDGRVSYLKDDFLTIPAIRPITRLPLRPTPPVCRLFLALLVRRQWKSSDLTRVLSEGKLDTEEKCTTVWLYGSKKKKRKGTHDSTFPLGESRIFQLTTSKIDMAAHIIGGAWNTISHLLNKITVAFASDE